MGRFPTPVMGPLKDNPADTRCHDGRIFPTILRFDGRFRWRCVRDGRLASLRGAVKRIEEFSSLRDDVEGYACHCNLT